MTPVCEGVGVFGFGFGLGFTVFLTGTSTITSRVVVQEVVTKLAAARSEIVKTDNLFIFCMRLC